jgi:hypothetical protein
MANPSGKPGPKQDLPSGRDRMADVVVLIIRVVTELVRLLDAIWSGSWSGPA